MKEVTHRRMRSLVCVCFLFAYGCGSSVKASADPGTRRTTVTDILLPQEGTASVAANDAGTCKVDTSNTSQGYFFVTYTGTADKVQIQVTNPDGTVYPYPLTLNQPEDFPLTGGSGSYQLNVFEHVSGDNYAVCMSTSFEASLADEFRPYLTASQYIYYTAESESVQKGISISNESSDDLDYIQRVYDYVTGNVTYDDAFAANPPTNYIPDPDRTLDTQKGICFDYASLMCAMLRSQGIPTKLQVGYAGTVYHAWISVWLQETGWVDGLIRFDGTKWTLMDPTLASYTSKQDVADYTSNLDNYYVEYNY